MSWHRRLGNFAEQVPNANKLWDPSSRILARLKSCHSDARHPKLFLVKVLGVRSCPSKHQYQASARQAEVQNGCKGVDFVGKRFFLLKNQPS